jgi:hypothetical protein
LNAVDISDYQVFPSRKIQKAAPVFFLPRAANEFALSDDLPAPYKEYRLLFLQKGFSR